MIRTLPLIAFVLAASLSPAKADSRAWQFAQAAQQESENPFTNQGDAANPRPPRKPGTLTLQISERDCRRAIVAHKPRGDVAYRPGIDVRGKPVVPADLPSGYALVTPTVIEFDLAFNPLGNTGLDPNDFANSQVSVGRIRFDILKNELTLNGRPLQNPVLAEIEKQCRAAGFLD